MVISAGLDFLVGRIVRSFKLFTWLLAFLFATNGYGQESRVFSFHETIAAGDYSTTAKMISLGGDINVVSKDGLTGLHVAVLKDDIRFIELLVGNGADYLAEGGIQLTPRELAETYGRRDIFHRLLVIEALGHSSSVYTSRAAIPPSEPTYTVRVMKHAGKVAGSGGEPYLVQLAEHIRDGEPDARKALWVLDPITKRTGTDGGAPEDCQVCINRMWYSPEGTILESAGGCNASGAVLLLHIAEMSMLRPSVYRSMKTGDHTELVTRYGSGCPAEKP